MADSERGQDMKPQAWIEFIDPETGRKMDVVVSFHADWVGVGEEPRVTASWVNRFAQSVIDAMPVELSDYEPAPEGPRDGDHRYCPDEGACYVRSNEFHGEAPEPREPAGDFLADYWFNAGGPEPYEPSPYDGTYSEE